jgi:hypothetical protein
MYCSRSLNNTKTRKHEKQLQPQSKNCELFAQTGVFLKDVVFRVFRAFVIAVAFVVAESVPMTR